MITLDKIQELADKMTIEALSLKYGKETIDAIDNIEDTQYNDEWETLNEFFFVALKNFCDVNVY